MKIICSGMSKTGTKTLCEALRTLGFKVYDFEEQYFYQSDDWFRFLETRDRNILKEMYKDVDAITDTPACVFWEELMEIFPEAKVVHMERQGGEESYVKACRVQTATLHKLKYLYWISPNFRKLKKHLMMAGTLVAYGLMKPDLPWQLMEDWPAAMALRYRQTNTRVKEVVPKEKLLEFKHQDGWKPLCEFLGVEIPKTEYPHRNKGGSITDEIVDTSYIFEPIHRDVKISAAVIVCLLAIAAYMLWNLFH